MAESAKGAHETCTPDLTAKVIELMYDEHFLDCDHWCDHDEYAAHQATQIIALVRASVAEEIAADITATLAYFGLKPTPWADGYTNGNRDAAAIARRHAVKAPESHAAGTEPGGGSATKDDTRDDRQEQ